MKKSVEHLLPEVWRALWGNPIIFVPPAAVFFSYVLLSAGFSAVFLGAIATGIHNIGDLYNHFAYGDWQTTLAGFTIYTALMFAAFITVVGLLSLFHSAGWGNMFARIAVGGSADMGDYFEGIARFTVRMGVGEFLKQCIHVIPALFLAALWGVLMLVFAGSGAAVTLCFLLLTPLFLIVQALIKFFLLMWRPACFIDDLQVFASFGRSCRFARENWLSLIIVFVIWSAGSILLFISFSLLTSAAQMVFAEMEKIVDAPFQFAMSAGAGFLLWAFGFAVSVFFTLYFYAFYHNRGIREGVPEAAPGGDLTQPAAE